MPVVTFIPGDASVTVSTGVTIRQAYLQLDDLPELTSDCDGSGQCGQCLVRIISGAVSEHTQAERRAAGRFSGNVRLACQCQVAGDCTIELLSVRHSFWAEVPPPQWLPTPDRSFGKPCVAIDIGTTSITAYLIASGDSIKPGLSVTNPQSRYGADVMSRLGFALSSKANRKRLQRSVVWAINSIIDKLTAAITGDLDRILIVGNPAMVHLLLGLDVDTLARAPFTPITTKHHLSGDSIGLCGDASIYIPPPVGHFIGADHVAALSYCLYKNPPLPAIVIDVGTNTELSVVTGDKIISCSCASGPAFEGGNIKHGMKLAPGAIDRVYEDLSLSVHGGGTPLGICGSGLISLLSVLLTTGMMDKSGKLSKPINLSSIIVTQKDIRNLQLATSAIKTALTFALTNANITSSQIACIYITGAFGRALPISAAKHIGLLPSISEDKVIPITSGAAAGAISFLISSTFAEEALSIARSATHIELASQPGFNRAFIDNLTFG